MPQVDTFIDIAAVVPPSASTVLLADNRIDRVTTTYGFCVLTAQVTARNAAGVATAWTLTVSDTP